MSAQPFDLTRFASRLIVDAINEASRGYWLRRSEEFAAAMPAADDYRGASSTDDTVARALRIKAKSDACRNRAELCQMTDDEELLASAIVEEMLVGAA